MQLSLSQPVCHRNYEPGCVLISKPGAASQLQVRHVAHGCEQDKQHLMIVITASHHMGAIIDHILHLSLTHIQYKKTYTHTDLSSHVLSVISDLLSLRWVLCANHTEPVKGFLARFMRRKLIETEIDKNMRSNDLIKIIDWIPKTWQHLNSFLEAHSSSDVTIGNTHKHISHI